MNTLIDMSTEEQEQCIKVFSESYKKFIEDLLNNGMNILDLYSFLVADLCIGLSYVLTLEDSKRLMAINIEKAFAMNNEKNSFI